MAGNRGATALRVLGAVGFAAGLLWLINTGTVDWSAALWDRPGRVTALVVGLVAVLLVRTVLVRKLAGTGQLVPVLPLAIALVIGTGGAYLGGAYGRTLGPDCKSGQALNRDGVCVKAPRPEAGR